MKVLVVTATFLFLIGSSAFSDEAKLYRAEIRARLTTEKSDSQIVALVDLEEGKEKQFGSGYPKLKLLVLSGNSDNIPIQLSLVSSTGQILSSTIVYFPLKTGVNFSLEADGVGVRGRVNSFSN